MPSSSLVEAEVEVEVGVEVGVGSRLRLGLGLASRCSSVSLFFGWVGEVVGEVKNKATLNSSSS